MTDATDFIPLSQVTVPAPNNPWAVISKTPAPAAPDGFIPLSAFSDLPAAKPKWQTAPVVEDAAPPKAGGWQSAPLVEEPPSQLRRFMQNQPTQIGGGWFGREAEGLGAGAFRGLARAGLGAAELAGETLKALGMTQSGDWLARNVRAGNEAVTAATAPDIARAPTAGTIGELGSYVAGPGRALGLLDTGRPLADALTQGAAAGALQPTSGQDFWHQKAEQVGLGTVGGGLAHGIGNALAGLIAPRLPAAANALARAGVQLTPGQMAGGMAKTAEDKFSSLPLTGDAIDYARRKGIESFNVAALNKALEPIGSALPPTVNAGRGAILEAGRQFQNAYDSVVPRMVGRLDPGLQSDLVNIATLARNLPTPVRDELDGIIKHDVLTKFSPGGGISGRTVQEIGTSLDNLIDKLKQSEFPDRRRMGTAIQELDASLDRMMARNNPTLAPIKQRIDAGYAQYKTIAKASGMQGAKDGIFTPAQLANAVRSRDKSKDKMAWTKGYALLQDFSDAAEKVLPSQYPDSGAAGRLILNSLLTGGSIAAHNPFAIGALGVGALPYTRPALSAMNALAQPAGPVRNALANIVRTAGTAGAPTAAQGAVLAVPAGNP